MNFVALKMLVGDRLKYLALIAGVSFAALLITQQASIFAGYTLRTGSWIRGEPTHWQRGAPRHRRGLTQTLSFVPDSINTSSRSVWILYGRSSLGCQG